MAAKTSKPSDKSKTVAPPRSLEGPLLGPRIGPSAGARGLAQTPLTGAGAPPPVGFQNSDRIRGDRLGGRAGA
jgi:hypothetical protein